MLFSQDLTHFLPQNLFDRLDDIEKYRLQAANYIDNLMQNDELTRNLLGLASFDEDLAEIERFGKNICKNFEHLVVLGTGGSTLSGQALLGLKFLEKTKPTINFMDNIDPYSFKKLFKAVNPAKCFFLVISKSGETPETLAQALWVINYFQKNLQNLTLSTRMCLITDAKPNSLLSIMHNIGAQVINHYPIGGRFSILSNVGLLPAYCGGMDIKALRNGALWYLNNRDNTEYLKSAAIIHLLQQNRYNMKVLMPYFDSLSNFCTWFRQIWAESLGKNRLASTPIKAMGTLDQHSQLQLYLDGPADKIFSFIIVKEYEKDHVIDISWFKGINEAKYIGNHTLGNVIEAEQQATIECLVNKNLPVRKINLNKINEESLGALIMHFTLETLAVAGLMGVNPYDQPAVEQGKVRTKEILLNGR